MSVPAHQPADLSRALAGVDSSRRVGWAKAYANEEVAIRAVTSLLMVHAALREDDVPAARGLAAGALRRLLDSPDPATQSVIAHARQDLDAVWEWVAGSAPPPTTEGHT